MRRFTPILMLLCVFAMVSPLAAHDPADDHAAAAAAANNPLANMTSFQLQNYYIPELYGLPDETSNTAWLRFVKPFGKVVKSGRSLFNIFFEPQFTILHDGQGYPAFQVFAGASTCSFCLSDRGRREPVAARTAPHIQRNSR